MASERDIVEAGDNDVVGHPEPRGPKRLQGADGHIVVAREHCIEAMAALEQLFDGPLTRSLLEIPSQHFAGQARGRQSLRECRGPFISVEVSGWSGDMDNPLAPEGPEMVHHRSSSRRIVEMDGSPGAAGF